MLLQDPQRSLVPGGLPKVTPLLTASVWRGPLEAESGDACRLVRAALASGAGLEQPATHATPSDALLATCLLCLNNCRHCLTMLC